MATKLLSFENYARLHVPPQRRVVGALHARGHHKGIAAIALGSEVPQDAPAVRNVAPGGQRRQPDAAIVPYMTKLDAHLGRVGMDYFPEVHGTPKDARDAVARHQALGNKVIVMLPNDESVVRALAPGADIDGLTPAGRLQSYPATALATLDGLDRSLPGGIAAMEPDRLTFVGDGRLVNGPGLDKLEEQWGIRPGRVINRKNAELLDSIHKTSDAVIVAVGRAGLLGPEQLLRRGNDDRTRPLVVVDAGVSVMEGTGSVVTGDVHPSLYFYDGPEALELSPAPTTFGVERVRFGCGVGSLTVPMLANNAIRAMEIDIGMEQTVPQYAAA